MIGSSGAREIHRLAAGSWTTLNADDVFGRASKHKQFALIGVGVAPTP
jgi:hypothetical protein